MVSHVRAIFKRAEAYKETFKDSQCLLLISVGQESHEAERFEATIDLIEASFGSCIILLYDCLQRHTMALSSTKEPDFFHGLSKKQGDLWLERNEKYYSKLTILKRITRWDEWLNHPDFIVQRKKLIALMDSDPSYRAVFDNTIDVYLDRYCKRLSNVSGFDEERSRHLCLDYLLEECTVLCLWPELQCQFDIYPNRHNNAMEETRSRLVRPYWPDLLHPVTVSFRNAKQVKPQHFELLTREEVVV